MFGRRASLPESDVLQWPGASLSYSIRESRRRRTLGLELRADGSVHVAVPRGVRLGDVRRFVESRRDWLNRKRALLAEAQARRVPLETGTRLPYLGTELTLSVEPRPTARAGCRREQGVLRVRAAHDRSAPRVIEAWYRRQALRHAGERVAYFSPLVGRAPRRLAIRAQRTRWGSCSSRGTVTLNWRLLQMPATVFDYVVVHELCHLVVANHSSRFWAEVERVLPDYRERRATLRRLGRCLQF
jgi:predicted metal-dependent hydrolase